MKKYVVVSLDQNPYDYSFNTPVLALIELDEKGERINDGDFPILYGEQASKLVAGNVVDESRIKLEWTSKKSKHLCVNDKVVFGKHKHCVGTVSKIVEQDEDLDAFWTDEFHLTDCHIPAHEIFVNEAIEKEKIIKRKDLECRPWLVATISCPCCGRF